MRARLWTNRYIKSGYKPPKGLLRRLNRIYPWVRLEWHPELQRWTLWEKNGRELSLIAVLSDADGGYVHPNLDVIRFLDERFVRSRIHNEYDLDRWLEEIDSAGAEALADKEREAQARWREGSSRLYDQLYGRKLVQVRK